jgi:hypothetical protein
MKAASADVSVGADGADTARVSRKLGCSPVSAQLGSAGPSPAVLALIR